MNLHVCHLHPVIRTSERFARLTWFERDLFYGLLNAAELNGHFENRPGLIRAAIYAPMLSKVTERDVERALQRLHSAELVKLYVGED